MASVLPDLGVALQDHYRLDRELGHGGMATVWLAQDLKHGRPVALKILRPELAATLGTDRFLREIELTSRLTHPHILPLHDSGLILTTETERQPGLPYYTMPYVEGESLRARLVREKQLPLDEALQVAREVADALSYAHAHDVLHRDIKPENILLEGGHAVVADFGIAKALSAAANADDSSAGMAVGTPAYMSPEQASGGHQLDARSDIYALGCVLYEMLAGQAPFTGPTAESVARQHIAAPVPSVRVVRPNVPQAVEEAITRALAKVPADRYSSAAVFAAALDQAARRPRWTRRHTLVAGVLVGVGLTGAGLWRLVLFPPPPLDPNKVVVFPLAESPTHGSEGTGEQVALLIGTALEHTEPLKWIDGWTWLDPAQRADVGLLSAVQARRISRRQGARYYLDGDAVHHGDSATVVLRLYDAAADTVLGRSSATTFSDQAPEGGLRAVNQLLPLLLARGRRIDLRPLEDRRPAAVAAWLQGEREYRRGNFDSALTFLRQAVNEDSLLAVAALRGAQAASWKNRIPEALQLAQTALADVTFLPERQVDFARGLAHYLNGRADSAVHWLSQALRRTPDWAEAHMALGEVYQHLLPIAAVPLDSLARQEFAAAARDTGFAPPHFHLAELAIRSHDLDQAKRAVDRFDQFGSASEERMELDLMLACLERREAVDWRTAAREAPLVVLGSAKMLSVAGSFPGCAEDGTRALRAATTDQALNWGAFLLLENLLAIAGRDRAIISLVDSVRDTGLWQATTAYLIGALAGTTRFESKATETVAAMAKVFGPHYEDSLDGGRLLLLGTWYARTGRTADAKRLHARLVRRAASSGNSEARLFADALQAHVLLARGDSDAALIQFQKLAPIAGRDVLLWGYAESLPVERLTEARLLFSRHRYWAALAVAEAFDHPTPIVYLTFLPASLALRYRAAQALGQSETAAGFKERLLVLGRADLFTRGD